MSGAGLRMARLFDRTSGRTFITAFDHGSTVGPRPGSEDALFALARIVNARPDGVLMAPGIMKQAAPLFGFRGAPAPIVRADWIFNHDVMKGLPGPLRDTAQGEHYRVICSPRDALEMGADAITMFLIVGAQDGGAFADNVRDVAAAANDARVAGIPLIVESVLWGARIADQRDPELLAFAARVAAELGADLIKTAYTGDPETMRQVIAGCPVPVLVLGGVRAATPEPVLAATREAIAAGARGAVYGRNVWQADDPAAMCRLLREAIHGEAGSSA